MSATGKNARDRRSLSVPAMDGVGRQITVHVGSQRLRIPTEFLIKNAAETLEELQEWKRGAGPKELAVYTALKGAVNLALPLLRSYFDRSRIWPKMPPRERHSDPIMYLAGYCHVATAYVLSKGEFKLTVDDADEVTSLEWSHLEQLKAIIAAERLVAAPQVLDAAPDDEEGDL